MCLQSLSVINTESLLFDPSLMPSWSTSSICRTAASTGSAPTSSSEMATRSRGMGERWPTGRDKDTVVLISGNDCTTWDVEV